MSMATSNGTADPTVPRWFACYTRSRHERQVRDRLARQAEDVFLPVVPLRRQWHDREKVVDFPMFPGYLFVRVPPLGLAVVYRVPGLVQVVSDAAGRPAAIPEDDIEAVRRFAEFLSSGRPVPELVPFEEGTPVKVTSGPLAGIRGVVVDDRSQGRVLVMIGVREIGQGMRILVDAKSLTSLEPSEQPR